MIGISLGARAPPRGSRVTSTASASLRSSGTAAAPAPSGRPRRSAEARSSRRAGPRPDRPAPPADRAACGGAGSRRPRRRPAAGGSPLADGTRAIVHRPRRACAHRRPQPPGDAVAHEQPERKRSEPRARAPMRRGASQPLAQRAAASAERGCSPASRATASISATLSARRRLDLLNRARERVGRRAQLLDLVATGPRSRPDGARTPGARGSVSAPSR